MLIPTYLQSCVPQRGARAGAGGGDRAAGSVDLAQAAISIAAVGKFVESLQQRSEVASVQDQEQTHSGRF